MKFTSRRRFTYPPDAAAQIGDIAYFFLIRFDYNREHLKKGLSLGLSPRRKDEPYNKLVQERVKYKHLRQSYDQLAGALEQANRSRQHLLRLFEIAPDACFLCDKTGKIVRVNRAGSELSGFSATELVGKNILKDKRLFNRKLFPSGKMPGGSSGP